MLLAKIGDGKLIVKICDFGLARKVEASNYDISTSSNPIRWTAPVSRFVSFVDFFRSVSRKERSPQRVTFGRMALFYLSSLDSAEMVNLLQLN